MASPDTIYKEKIDAFYGGMPDDVRMQNKELSFIAQHFDIFTNPKRITPHRSMKPDEDTSLSIVLFLYYNSILHGLGIVSATAKAKVYYSSGGPLGGTWTALANGFDSGGTRSTKCFLEFHGYAYGGAAGTRIWAADLSGVAAFTSSAYSTAGEPVCQGIKTTDDILIIPCSSGIAKKDGAGAGPTANWSTYAIVPASHTATDICEYTGELVAIAAKPLAGSLGVNSKVFLWDKVNLDPAQVIDFGEGDLLLLDEQEGQLVGVLAVGANSGLSTRAKLVVRVWSGGTKAVQVKEVQADNGTMTIYGNHAKAKEGNRLVFALKITLDGTTYNQLFAIGRKTTAYPLALTGDRLVDNNTAITSIEGLIKLGTYYFVAHNNDGSINRTNDQADYTSATAIYITNKLNGESVVRDAARRRKVLKMAGLLTAPLTSGQSVSLYYRTDGNSSWTLIRTYTYGDDAAAVPARVPANMGFEAGKDASPADFKNYKEVQFKATASGGAEITDFVWAWQFAGADTISE